MITWFVKKIYYLFFALPFIFFVKNWYVFPLGLIGLTDFKKGVIIKLNSKIKIKVFDLKDALALKEIFYDNIYLFKNYGNNSLIVDIGANFGAFSIYATLANQKSVIFAIEPSNQTFKLLNSNIKLNRLSSRIKTFKYAISSNNSLQKLYDPGRSGLRHLQEYNNKEQYEIVKGISLESFFTRYKIRKCDFLKIDCEGAEYKIIYSTSQRILDRIKNISIEFHENIKGQNHRKLIKKLSKSGFKVKHIHNIIEKQIGFIYASK